MALLAGVDGCHGGWFVVLCDEGSGDTSHRVVQDFAAVLDHVRNAAMTVVDMPIGLLDKAQPGGRECDRQARRLLGVRGCTVFSPPVRAALEGWRCPPVKDKAAYIAAYDAANRANKENSHHNIGISRQCFGIFPKLAEVDRLMTPELQCRIRESHPEVAFALLNCGTPLRWNKHTKEGRNDRRTLLFDAGLPEVERILPEYQGDGRVAEDDILDAFVLVHVARRILRSDAVCLPGNPPTDRRGLRMEIWA